ncbi:putative Transcriptional regulator with XRE-family HTH domain [Azospirillaceae bacterium]
MTPGTFQTRLAIIAPNRGDVPRLAEKAGIPATTLYNYSRGRGEPQLTEAAKIAEAAGVCLEWLATGKGPMRAGEAVVSAAESTPAAPVPALDHALFGKVFEALTLLYREENARIGPAALGALAAEKYEEIASASDDPDDRRAMIKLVVAQLRKELRTPAATAAQGKRSA